MRTDAAFLLLVVALLLCSADSCLAMSGSLGAEVRPIVRPMDPSTTASYVYEGIIADVYCVRQRWAIDGADMLTGPEQHSLHCLVDIQECIDSGFCLLAKADNSNEYGCAYVFNSTETLAFKRTLEQDRMERTNLKIKFNATWESGLTGRMVVDYNSVVFTGKARDDLPITIVLIAAVVIALALGVVGGILNYRGVRLSPCGSRALQLIVMFVYFGVVVAVYLVAYFTFVANNVSVPVQRAFGVTMQILFFLVLLPTTKHFGIGYIVGSSYENFMKWHMLVGITLWVVMSCHGISMFVAFANVEPNGGFLFRFTKSKKANGAGFVAWVLLTVMFVTALLRGYFYTLFKWMHYLFFAVIGFAIWHHLPVAYFVGIPLLLYFFDMSRRFGRTCRADPRIVDAEYFEDANVSKVVVQLAHGLPESAAGQHVFLRFYGISRLAQHPFTLAWYDRRSRFAFFFIRNNGGRTWTRKVADAIVAASTPAAAVTDSERDVRHFKHPARKTLGEVSWTGPYGRLGVPLNTVTHAIVVVGGIGVTHLTNILSALANAADESLPQRLDDNHSEPTSAYNNAPARTFAREFPYLRKVSLLWVAREADLVRRIVPLVADAMQRIHAAQAFPEFGPPAKFDIKFVVHVTKDLPPEDVSAPFTSIRRGRPDFNMIFDEFHTSLFGPTHACEKPGPKVTRTCVYSCGPPQIVDAARLMASRFGVLSDEQQFSIAV